MKPVKQYIPTGDFIKDWENAGFTPRKISEAAKIAEKMIKDKDCMVFLGLAGALIPAGMRNILADFIKNEWVDAVVVTGAMLTHDLFEALGHHHYQGNEKEDDKKLRDEKIDRIWDVYLKDEVYEDLEDFCQRIFAGLEKKKYSTRDLIWEIGKHLKDEDSIIRQSYLKQIPIFCPALADCGLGLQVWNFKLEHELDIDVFKDWDHFVVDMVWSAKKTGAILLGGGVPKNFILQAQQFSEKEHSYAVQVTMAQAVDGGLSGAELREAISWGKLGKNSEYADVRADVTIVLPLIHKYLTEQLK